MIFCSYSVLQNINNNNKSRKFESYWKVKLFHNDFSLSEHCRILWVEGSSFYKKHLWGRRSTEDMKISKRKKILTCEVKMDQKIVIFWELFKIYSQSKKGLASQNEPTQNNIYYSGSFQKFFSILPKIPANDIITTNSTYLNSSIVYFENAWTSNQMITEGEAAILLETTRRAFRNQSQSKQRSTLKI